MLNLQLPQNEFGPAAAFTQAGDFLCAGARETCEQIAREHGGLYCWIDNGKPVLRTDFGDIDDDTVRLANDDGRTVIIELSTIRASVEIGSDDTELVTMHADAINAGVVCLFSAMGMPPETHDDYIVWMRWAGWTCSKPDSVRLRAALEDIIERTMTV